MSNIRIEASFPPPNRIALAVELHVGRWQTNGVDRRRKLKWLFQNNHRDVVLYIPPREFFVSQNPFHSDVDVRAYLVGRLCVEFPTSNQDLFGVRHVGEFMCDGYDNFRVNQRCTTKQLRGGPRVVHHNHRPRELSELRIFRLGRLSRLHASTDPARVSKATSLRSWVGFALLIAGWWLQVPSATAKLVRCANYVVYEQALIDQIEAIGNYIKVYAAQIIRHTFVTRIAWLRRENEKKIFKFA